MADGVEVKAPAGNPVSDVNQTRTIPRKLIVGPIISLLALCKTVKGSGGFGNGGFDSLVIDGDFTLW